MAEVWVLVSGTDRRGATENGNKDAKDICGEATGNSGRVGGNLAYFYLCAQEMGYTGGGRI